jgi:hypothetical protein
MSAPEGGRRRFVLGALGMGAFTVAGGLNALVASAADKPAAAPAAPSPEEKPPEISEEARALHAVLVGRWGQALDEAQKQGLLEAIENNVQNGKALRAKPLFNGQEPPTVFYVTPPAPR